jgi:hypothetical protein
VNKRKEVKHMIVQRTEATGLTLEELERQAAGLLPDRVEMRRRRRRRRKSSSTASSTAINNYNYNDPDVIDADVGVGVKADVL